MDQALVETLERAGFLFDRDWPSLKEKIVTRVEQLHGPEHARMFRRNLGSGETQNEGMRWDIVDALGAFMESQEEANALMSVHGPQVLAATASLAEWLGGMPHPVRVGEIGAWTGSLGAILTNRGLADGYVGFEPVAAVVSLTGGTREKRLVLPYTHESLKEHTRSCDVVMATPWLHRGAIYPFGVAEAPPTLASDLKKARAVSAAMEFFRPVFRSAAVIATATATLVCLRRLRSMAELVGMVAAGKQEGWQFSDEHSSLRSFGDVGYFRFIFSRVRPSVAGVDVHAVANWIAGQFRTEMTSIQLHSCVAVADYLKLDGRRKLKSDLIQHELGGILSPPRLVEVGRWAGGYYRFTCLEGLNYELEVSGSSFVLNIERSRTTKDLQDGHKDKVAKRRQASARNKRRKPALIEDMLGINPYPPASPVVAPLDPLLDAYLRNDDRAERKIRRSRNEAEARNSGRFVATWRELQELLEEWRRRCLHGVAHLRSHDPSRAEVAAPDRFAKVPTGEHRLREQLDPEEQAIEADSIVAIKELREQKISLTGDGPEEPSPAALFFNKLRAVRTEPSDVLAAIEKVFIRLTNILLGTIKTVAYHEKKHGSIAELGITRGLHRCLTPLKVLSGDSGSVQRVGKRKLEFPLADKRSDASSGGTSPVPPTLYEAQQDLLFEMFDFFSSLEATRGMNDAVVDGTMDLRWLSAVLASRRLQQAVRRARAGICALRRDLDDALAGSSVPAKTQDRVRRSLATAEGWMVHAIGFRPV
ncbi:hypothetical protein GC173_16565 [bacterium]|nr:hypothetical protein [bacterium]